MVSLSSGAITISSDDGPHPSDQRCLNAFRSEIPTSCLAAPWVLAGSACGYIYSRCLCESEWVEVTPPASWWDGGASGSWIKSSGENLDAGVMLPTAQKWEIISLVMLSGFHTYSHVLFTSVFFCNSVWITSSPIKEGEAWSWHHKQPNCLHFALKYNVIYGFLHSCSFHYCWESSVTVRYLVCSLQRPRATFWQNIGFYRFFLR